MKKSAFLLILLAGILWGTSGIFAHYMYPYGFTPLELVFCRASMSFLLMAGYALLRDRSLFRVRLKELPLLLLVGLGIFGTASLYYTAMAMTSVSTAVVLMYTAPVYVLLVSVLFLGERLSRLKLLSIGLMLLGCCLVAGIIGGLRFTLWGILAGVASGLTYAIYNLLVKIAVGRGNPPLSVTMYAFLSMAVAAALCVKPQSLFAHVTADLPLTLPMAATIGISTCILPYLFYTLAMRDLSAGTASALGVFEPMAATLFSILFFGDRPDVYSLVGMVLILLAVVLLGKAEDLQNKEVSQ